MVNNSAFKNKWLSLIVFILLFGLILSKIIEFRDYIPTVIINGSSFKNTQNIELLKGINFIDYFVAKNNNLGSVAIKFDTHFKDNNDFIQFRIKEIGSDNWYYVNKYNVAQFQNNQYFSFGFPPIINSRNKTYQIEVESLSGVEGNSVQLKVINSYLLSKYSYPKQYLLKHKNEIVWFIVGKLFSFFCNIDKTSYLIIFYSFVIYLISIGLRNTKLTMKRVKLFDIFVSKMKLVTRSKIEVLLVMIFFFVSLFLLTRLLFYKNMLSQYGDTTFAAQIMLNIKKNLNFDSSYARSISYSLDEVWYRDAKYVCESKLVTPTKFPPWGHYYFIAFPLGILLNFVDIYWFLALSQALIYLSVLLFVYVLARKLNLNIINSFLLVLISMQNPLWIQGLYGQFYFNRFFLIFCSLVIILLSNKKLNYFLIVAFSLLAISSNEIYGISLFMVFIVYMYLHGFGKKLSLMAILSLVTSMTLISIINHSAQSSSTQNGLINHMFSGGLTVIINNFIRVIFTEQSGKFLLVNFIFGGFIIIFKPKLFLAWLFFLMPNLMVFIGKLGWSTHYHISYFVPNLWLLVYCVSLIKFRNKLFLSILLFIYLISISRFSVDNYKFGLPSFALDRLISDSESFDANKDIILNRTYQLQSSVDKTDSISMPEGLSFLFLEHEIFYYPVELDNVDKVMLIFDKNKIGDARYYSINYGQQADDLDICILARMRKNNFDLDNPKIIENIAIISKIKSTIK